MSDMIQISENKRTISLWLLRSVLFFLLLIELLNQRYEILSMNIVVLGVSFLPSILKRLFFVSLPYRFEILFISFLIIAVSIEKIFTGFIIEFILGMVYGIVGFILMDIIYVNSRIKISYALIMLFSFSFSVAIGSLWEVLRYLLTVFFEFRLGDINEIPTAIGLMLTILGASTILGIIYLYTHLFHGSFFTHLTDDIIRSNPSLFSLNNKEVKEITTMISKGENEQVEFKSTLRMNIHTGKVDKKIEFVVLKTIVAFLNTNGGTLLIGVKDNGDIEGIERDCFDTHDLLYRHFTNLFRKHIGKEYISYIRTRIIKIQEKHILVIECAVSQEHVFLTHEDKEFFFIRMGPTSVLLEGKDLISYIKKRY